MANCTKHPVGRYWKHFVLILTPLLLLLPLLLIPDSTLPKKPNQCLYVMLLMAVYWCTEVLPLAVTALIPIFIFPMLSILTTEEVCNQFLKDTVMMFVGGLMVALAVEKCNLHKRIAVNVLHAVGAKPLWLMLGFMLPTWFLSMWISNTATTAMMLPISEAVLDSLAESYKQRDKKTTGEEDDDDTTDSPEKSGKDNPAFSEPYDKDVLQPNGGGPVDMAFVVFKGDDSSHPDVLNTKNYQWNQSIPDRKNSDSDSDSEDPPAAKSSESNKFGHKTTGNAVLDKFAKGMTIAIAYAANTGGTATLTGTGPNPIMKGHADDVWKENGLVSSPVTFASWCVYGMPMSAIIFLFIWLYLTVFFNGFKALCPNATEENEDSAIIKRVIDDEYRQLGKISFAEIAVSLMFFAMVVLWFFRSPGFIIGWSDLSAFEPGYVDDASVSIFIAFVLCLIPSKIPTCKSGESGPVETLLDWKTVQQKLPWGIIFLMGGGFSLAQASTKSGLSDWIAEQLSVMASWPGWVMVLVLCLIVTFMTEVTSNSATCTILMPIASSLAEGIGANPLYLMFPVALSTSFAFMLPVATPPNAIAFSFGRIKIIDMVKAGMFLNFFCVGILTMATHTWADAFFDFGTIPWNVTVSSPTSSP